MQNINKNLDCKVFEILHFSEKTEVIASQFKQHMHAAEINDAEAVINIISGSSINLKRYLEQEIAEKLVT